MALRTAAMSRRNTRANRTIKPGADRIFDPAVEFARFMDWNKNHRSASYCRRMFHGMATGPVNDRK